MPRSWNGHLRRSSSRSATGSPQQRKRSRSYRISSGNCAGRNKLGLARARPGELEAPAMLRFQAQAKRLFQLARRRGDAVAREAHEKARGDHHAVPEHAHAALRDVASMQVELAVEVSRDVALPVGSD